MAVALSFGLLFATVAELVSAQTTGEAGEVVLVRGLATAQTLDGGARIIGPGSAFGPGDFLRTASGTFAVVRFADDTRMTLRPATTLEVEAFEYSGPNDLDARAELYLHEGGARIDTGRIADLDPDRFVLATPHGRIRVRGTDFEVRLCRADCEDAQLVAVTDPSIVAKIAFVSGEVTATDESGQPRPLFLQAALRAGDTVRTGPGALAIVIYRDESRATLRPESELEIVALEYDPEDEARSSAIMRFIKGGVRVLSGAISRARPKEYRVETPVAILSVRGTGFDLLCQGAARPADCDGMDIWVFEGAVGFPFRGQDFVVGQGTAVFFDGFAAPRTYPQVPATIQQFDWPETDPSLDGQDLFGAAAPDDGLYVRVNEGSVEVSDGVGPDLVADAGETVFGAAGDGGLELLDGGVALPVTPDPALFGDAKVGEIFEFLARSSEAPQDSYQCTIQ